MTLFEFQKDFWHQKTRVPGLSCGIVCIILRLAALVELQLVTDTQTQCHGIYRAEHSSRGKNGKSGSLTVHKANSQTAHHLSQSAAELSVQRSFPPLS